MAEPKQGVVRAMNWMGGLALLLFWLPGIGPLIAGFVGGTKAGSLRAAIAAVFLPGILTGLLTVAGVTYLADWGWGMLAGIGVVAWSFLNIGPMLLGAIAGGLVGSR